MEIKNRFTDNVLFSFETKAIKLCLEAAVRAGADLRGANLGSADLRDAYLRDADLRGADLRGANLGSAYLSDADLRDADLRDAYLSDADLRDADLRGANLGSADLRDADLRDAYLSDANLGSADLRDADLRDAYLRGANLRDANLGSAENIYYKITPLSILLDQPGDIRAYKLINQNGEGPYFKGIVYEIGQEYTVEDADCDIKNHCAKGINIATLDWCISKWQASYRILIVEFTAKDIAAIPIATDGKFRVKKCKVVGEKDLKEIGLI